MGSRKSFNWEILEVDKLWYFIGLITADGSLSKDKRHIDITSKDVSFLKGIKKSLNLSNKITTKINGVDSQCYRIQIGSISLYNFLLSVGLFPNKSLTLGELQVPQDQFCHFLRGIIDGDGCIRRWVHPTNKGEQWSLRISGGSETFLRWLQNETIKIFGVKGEIYKDALRSKNIVLKFGKLAAQEILSRCYTKNKLALNRKGKLAHRCIETKRGWSKSKTIGLKHARVVEQEDTRDSGKGSPIR